MADTRRSIHNQHTIVGAAHEHGIILDSREVFISGNVDEEGEMAKNFLINMRILLSHSREKPIVIHQYSLGGDWCSGMAIFDNIATCPCPIVFICHGLACSMGSIIPMACVLQENSYRICMPNCSWLLHDGTTEMSDSFTYKQAQSWALWEKDIRTTMIDVYLKALSSGPAHEGKTRAQIKAFINGRFNAKEDWWLSAAESVEHGLTDGVLGEEGYESIPDILAHFS